MSTLDSRLQEIARVPILLIASDYDGTVAPIVDDPAAAAPHREAIVALRMLMQLPQTHVSVISGRALAELAELTGLPNDVHLVGSHGSEFDLDYPMCLPPDAQRLRRRIAKELASIAANGSNLHLEEKPASVALHYRNAPEDDASRALSEVSAGPGAIEGVFTKHGKKVVELCVVETNKGRALETIRHRCGASAAIFIGDDATDEDAFTTLRGPDIGVKVGAGDSAAPFRVDGPDDVARLLARLGQLRAEWLEGAQATPIEEHSVLSDLRTIALVGPAGRITWMCAPRIDSSALFAELVGGPDAGYFSVRPIDSDEPVNQEYSPNAFVLTTTWRDCSVTDLLDCTSGRTQQRAGRSDLVRVVRGVGRVLIEFAPRLDFGRIETRIAHRNGGLQVEDTLDPIVLRSPGVEWSIHREGRHDTARAEVTLGAEPLVLELRCGASHMRDGRLVMDDRIRLNELFWSSWAEQLQVPAVAPDLVRRSALVLRALCHGPSGAIAAAGTTSLPEYIGGVRNWDYRYCWLRDAAMSVSSLVRLGSLDEAMSFLNWMLGVLDRAESPERLHPLYTVTGEELGPEGEIAELSGYSGSRPVRISNGASRQVQIDVFGTIVDLIALLLENDAPLSSEHWRIVEAMVRAVERRWRDPDHGIWEIRRARRHHVHSKVLCWMTVDRAITVADRFLEREIPGWEDLRNAISADILANGFKREVNAFTAAYDDIDLDAAALLVGLSGLLPPDDDRFVGTVEVVERALRSGATVHRYHADDGLPGFEGGFHLCTGWLISSYLLLGRTEDARQLFDELCTLAGPTGMLSEQYGAKSRRALGNVPQAYSHLAIIDTALQLEAAGGGASSR